MGPPLCLFFQIVTFQPKMFTKYIQEIFLQKHQTQDPSLSLQSVSYPQTIFAFVELNLRLQLFSPINVFQMYSESTPIDKSQQIVCGSSVQFGQGDVLVILVSRF